jgi:dipeptidyl aminopeptidase/acylaminoacyl peptidase
MKGLINYTNLSQFAYSNDKLCEQPIRGIVLSFSGLGWQEMYSEDSKTGKYYAKHGIIYIVPYNNPWAWMNQQAVSLTDEIVDVIISFYNLSHDIPIVSTGGSMGGQSALAYMIYAKRTPITCVVNCPVCDMIFHYTERNDLPRTLYSAFYYYEGSLEEALKSVSPIHQVVNMPDASYYIFHCEKDEAVRKDKHSDILVNELSKNHFVTYHVIPDRGHCDLPEPMMDLYKKYVLETIDRFYVNHSRH